jgi:hypothetical protein
MLVIFIPSVVMADPPQLQTVSPTTGRAGDQVTLTGLGFGAAQGAGDVWLGSIYGVVVTWSDTQVVATIASGSKSGSAQILQGGVWSNSVTFTVVTPTITSVTPTSGVAGTQVTIAGTGFGATQGSGNVWLGSTYGVAVSWSDTQVVATIATGSKSGSAQILQGGVWSNSVTFTVVTPYITSVSPTTAVAGTQVTIAGTGFGAQQGSGKVWLGNTYGTVGNWSDTQVVATVATGAISGTAQVLQGGVWSNSVNFTVITPSITSVTPATGVAGTQVTIAGTGFGADQGSGKAWLGNTYGTVVSWSDTQVVATVASGAKSGTAQVLQGGVWSNSVVFTVTGPSKVLVSLTLAPANSTLPVGETQRFSATGTFSDGSTQDLTDSATWSSSNESIAVVDGTGVRGFTVPISPGTTTITATQTGIAASTGLTVVPATVPISPTISSVTPAGGVAGTQVSITGSGFGATQGTGYVLLGTAIGMVAIWNDSQIVATVAPGSSSGVAKVLQGGLESNSFNFTVTTPTISSVTPSGGVAGTTVIIAGSGFGAAQGSGQVWLGSMNGVVTSWSDTQVVAVVAAGAASGKAQILQNGVWSNSLSFTVNTPQIANVSPNPAASGATVTITGTGFGAIQGSGQLLLGSAPGPVMNWSDTQIIANVAPGALSGIARVQQNGIWSNAVPFRVSGSSGVPVTITPHFLNMVVGETRSIQAVDTQGHSVKSLAWMSSDPTVVGLSTDDPPVLTALAAGHVTITAGNASADVTVFADALPLGTVKWSNAGDGSGIYQVVPAVPSLTSVADVFAFLGSGQVAAVTADGSTAWIADASSGPSIPDFDGGLIIVAQDGLQKLDAATGQPRFSYTLANYPVDPPPVAASTDGTIFTVDGENVVGIDSATGSVKFRAAMQTGVYDYSGPLGEVCTQMTTRHETKLPMVFHLAVAGDGYAYAVYSFTNSNMSLDGCDGGYYKRDVHLRVLRVSTSGSASDIPIGDWSETGSSQSKWMENGGCTIGSSMASRSLPGVGGTTITNADKGVLLQWIESFTGGGCAYSYYNGCNNTGSSTGCYEPVTKYHLTAITGGTITSNASPQIELWAALQREDGTYIGTMSGVGMVAFDQAGSVKWTVPGYGPLMATADGGVIAQSGDGLTYATFDANGNATGLSSPSVFSWTGQLYTPTETVEWYPPYRADSVSVVAQFPIIAAPSYCAEIGGNPSGNGTAVATVPYLLAPGDSAQRTAQLEIRKDFVLGVEGGVDYTNMRNRVVGDCATFIKSMIDKIDASRYANTSALEFEVGWLKRDIFEYFGSSIYTKLGPRPPDAYALTVGDKIFLGEKFFSDSKHDDLLTIIHEIFHLWPVSPGKDRNLSHCELLKINSAGYPGGESVFFEPRWAQAWIDVVKSRCGTQ